MARRGPLLLLLLLHSAALTVRAEPSRTLVECGVTDGTQLRLLNVAPATPSAAPQRCDFWSELEQLAMKQLRDREKADAWLRAFRALYDRTIGQLTLEDVECLVSPEHEDMRRD